MAVSFDDKNILFASLDLPQINREQALAETYLIPPHFWIWDDYRSTSMLPIMTAHGRHDKNGMISMVTSETQSDFIWTDLAPPTVKAYFEEHIFSWIQPKPRIVILKTPAFSANKEHIDCRPGQMGSRQLKFRLVLSGTVESLYFITSKGITHAPKTEAPFLMDGSWPHGMKNESPEDKITICVGAPWTGSSTYPKFQSIITKDGLEHPANVGEFYQV